MKVSEVTNLPKRRFYRSLLVAQLISVAVHCTSPSLLVMLLLMMGLLHPLAEQAELLELTQLAGLTGLARHSGGGGGGVQSGREQVLQKIRWIKRADATGFETT